MESGLTSSQLVAAASDLLLSGGYSEVPAESGWSSNSRLFEDPYGIVALVVYDTWVDLDSTWTDAQGLLVELISEHFRQPEPKSWDGYLILLTPGIAPSDARQSIAKIRYNTSRVRKLIATGD